MYVMGTFESDNFTLNLDSIGRSQQEVTSEITVALSFVNSLIVSICLSLPMQTTVANKFSLAVAFALLCGC